jgi:hypothetical protein
MIFTVSESLKGSFVLNTLNRALSKGMTVSISGNDLYASDVKMAIASGFLISVGEEYGEDQIGVNHDVVIVNKTNRVIVLGETVLNPKGSLLVSKDILSNLAIRSAEKNGLIDIISKDAPKKKVSKKKVTKKKATKKKVVKKKVVEEEVFDEEKEQFIPGAERPMKAKVWNFREQESEDALLVPVTPDIIQVDEPEVEEVEFVDEPLEAQKVNVKKKKVTKKAKKKTTKKAKNKKAVKKTIKKKGKATKKRKVKALEPVGDKRIPKTQMDAAIELDSRGRPIENASDALNHLIDSVESIDVSFVDDEQAQARYNDRSDMD